MAKRRTRWVRVCGRRVKVVTQTKSQTVRICTEEGIHGQYEDPFYRFRGKSKFIEKGAIEDKDFESLDSLRHYLKDERGGIPEMSKRAGKVSLTEHRSFEGDEWVRAAVARVDGIVDDFIRAFVDHPYLHRVEHSLHCELYQMLCRDDVIGREVRMGDFATRLVHKEWPEFRPREGKRRRGNSDLAVLSPNRLAGHSLYDFLDGRIEPPMVIEMGLNCDHKHLRDDLEKLLASEVSRGYLIHLVRETVAREAVVDDFDGIERCLVGIEEEHESLRTGYARVSDRCVRFKLLGNPLIQTRVRRRD